MDERALPSSIDPTVLSTYSLSTLQQVAFRLLPGFNEREIASTLGVRPKDVQARLDELRAELRQTL